LKRDGKAPVESATEEGYSSQSSCTLSGTCGKTFGRKRQNFSVNGTLPSIAAAAGHMFLEKPLLIWLLSTFIL
jgi:hypothetical protein